MGPAVTVQYGHQAEHLSIETSKQTHGQSRYLHLANAQRSADWHASTNMIFMRNPARGMGRTRHDTTNIIDIKFNMTFCGTLSVFAR